jgi:hypothetical protein
MAVDHVEFGEDRRLLACIAASSVGKPAIRSAPMAMSGRRARRRSTSLTASRANGGASCA